MGVTEQDFRIRFAVFELDTRSGELRKAGTRIRLQDQPLKVLLALLDQPGEVISREELKRRIWPGDSFGDFDHAVNVAVAKLRTALGDSADVPRFVETLPRRGYRFIFPVTLPKDAEICTDAPATGARAKPTPTFTRLRWAAAGGSILIVVLAVGGWRLFSRKTQALTDSGSIVLADFTNTTGDVVFDGTLRQGLSVQLEQSPLLSITSDEQIQQTLQLMGKMPDAKLTPDVARELCQRAGGAAVIDGSIAQIGTQYLLTAKAVDCVSGKSLASTEAQASDKNEVLNAVGKLAVSLRNELGESLSMVQKFDTPLEQATTTSLDALKSLTSGSKVCYTSGSTAAIPFYEHAIGLDPKFALAYAQLGHVYWDIGESDRAAGYTQKAYELRDRVSEPERYFIQASYDMLATGNMEKAEQSSKLWIEAYPRSEMPHDFLAGIIYPEFGQYEKGVEEGNEAVRLSPNNPIPYSLLASNYMALNRLDEAKAADAQALDRKLNHPYLHTDLYLIAFLQNDAKEMAQQAASSAGEPGVEKELLGMEAYTAAYYGQFREARNLYLRSKDSAERAGVKETAATYSALSGLLEGLCGNAVAARWQAASALSQSNGRDVQYQGALALALVGDTARAQTIADDLGKRFPEDTIVRFVYLPTLRAQLALNHGDPSKAIEALQAAVTYELGGAANLYSAYFRGEAYLAAHRGKEACGEFQKVLDHRGIVLNDPIGALAHLQIARAYAMQGDTTKAKAAYQDFLTLWKDADQNIPILIAAKSEYSRLK